MPQLNGSLTVDQVLAECTAMPVAGVRRLIRVCCFAYHKAYPKGSQGKETQIFLQTAFFIRSLIVS